MLIQFIGRTLCSDKSRTRTAHNGGTERLTKVTNSKLMELIQPKLLQLLSHTLHSDNGGIQKLSEQEYNLLTVLTQVQ